MYKEIFHTKLKKARIDTGLSQEEVEIETGIDRTKISRYENGKREPDIETLGILTEFYGVSADWLLGIGKKNAS